MTERIKEEHIELWRKEGAVVVPEFFKRKEIDAVVEDFQIIFPDRQTAVRPIDNKEKGRIDSAKPMLRNKKVGTIKINPIIASTSKKVFLLHDR